eukprot:13719228-Ditylum_brightwellii.AAC.1
MDIEAIIAQERTDYDDCGQHLWITQKWARIKGCDKNYRLEGTIELQAIRGQLFRLALRSVRLSQVMVSDSDDVHNEDKTQQPKLSIYLSKKKVQQRSVDIEETGHLVLDSLFCEHNTEKEESFYVPLGTQKSNESFSEFIGVAFVKQRKYDPATEEPIIY